MLILAWQSVGALRKHAGGMFLASDLGGYAAVADTSPYTGEAYSFSNFPNAVGMGYFSLSSSGHQTHSGGPAPCTVMVNTVISHVMWVKTCLSVKLLPHWWGISPHFASCSAA